MPKDYYIYVRCFRAENGDPSFDSWVVKARDVDDAYLLGGRMSDREAPFTRGEGINDYVVPLPIALPVLVGEGGRADRIEDDEAE